MLKEKYHDLWLRLYVAVHRLDSRGKHVQAGDVVESWWQWYGYQCE